MRDRQTADIVADLRAVLFQTPLDSTRQTAISEAADRLAELDAKVTCTGAGDCKALAHIHGCYADEPCYHELDALRPPCPTCDGTMAVIDLDCRCDPEAVRREGPHDHGYPCPDCVDGRVSIEQTVATWRAVWEAADNPIGLISPKSSDSALAYTAGHRALLDHLRAVRP